MLITALNKLRIISGKWKSRKISFNDCNGIVRPTPDRVRETLFNWLSHNVQGVNCLDLYAGTGVLGFEALSRGAEKVVAVEKNPDICRNILLAKELLHANLELMQTDVIQLLKSKRNEELFDIVFLDPPYSDNILSECFLLLNKNNWVKPNSFIYYEYNEAVASDILPKGWAIIKQGKAGVVYYYLAQVNSLI